MLYEVLGGNLSFAQIIFEFLASLFVVLVLLPVHEMAHAFTAYKLGDNTAKYQGRLTLNPLAHIDYLGAALIILVGFGWANPVPVNARNFKNPKSGMAITALAGPVSNILVAFVLLLLNYLLIAIFGLSQVMIYATIFLNYAAQVNVYLAVFNLIPIPPLDGSRILTAVLPDRQYYKLMQYERYFFLIIILLIVTGILNPVIDFLFSGVWSGISWLAKLPFNFSLAL